MAKFKVKLINGKYVVGKDQKNSFGGTEFVLPIYGTKIYSSKTRAQKRADSLNK